MGEYLPASGNYPIEAKQPFEFFSELGFKKVGSRQSEPPQMP